MPAGTNRVMWKGRVPVTQTIQPQTEAVSILASHIEGLATQMGTVEERLGEHGADIRNVRDMVSRLDELFQSQSARTDVMHREMLDTINSLRADIQAATASSIERHEQLSKRVDELEHARTYSTGVVKTVKGLAAAVAGLFVALLGLATKWLFNN